MHTHTHTHTYLWTLFCSWDVELIIAVNQYQSRPFNEQGACSILVQAPPLTLTPPLRLQYWLQWETVWNRFSEWYGWGEGTLCLLISVGSRVIALSVSGGAQAFCFHVFACCVCASHCESVCDCVQLIPADVLRRPRKRPEAIRYPGQSTHKRTHEHTHTLVPVYHHKHSNHLLCCAPNITFLTFVFLTVAASSCFSVFSC